MKTGKELTLEWFERVWNQSDEAAIFEMMRSDCDVKGLALSTRGPDAFVEFHRAHLKAFKNNHFAVFELVEEEGHVMGNATLTAVHLKSGKPVEVIFGISAIWKDEKIVEARNVVDFTTLLTQIGALDPNELARAFEA